MTESLSYVAPQRGVSTDFERDRLQLLHHDIRSAVSDVVGGLEVLDMNALANSEKLQLERVRAAADTLGDLVDEILAEVSGEPVFTLALDGDRRLPLRDLLRQLERRWHGHAQAKGARLKLTVADDLPVLIDVESGALERILSNLLANALKFSEGGTVTLAVDLRAARDLRFVVQDQGPGFSEEALSRLFEFGGRPANSRRPGTGMGLHICKELADRMSAQLLVTNGPVGGAQVSLVLPSRAWRRAGDFGAAGKGVDLSHHRVLLAEDNPTNQLLFLQMLNGMHAEVTSVGDGKAALRALRQTDFDIALIDINMPELSGIEVIEHLRRIPGPRGQTPVLAVTAYVLRNFREQIYAAGANGILAKPILNASTFGQAIWSLVKQSDLPRPAPRPTSPTPILEDPQNAITQLLHVAGPDREAELLARLQEDFARAHLGLSEGITCNDIEDIEAVRRQTHVLISLAGTVGANRLLDLVQRMNAAAHVLDVRELVSIAPETLRETQAIREKIAEILVAREGPTQ